MWSLILSNLRQRPTRTCVSVLAVSLGVVLVLVSVGLSYGQLADQAQRTRQIGGHFMLQPSGASLFLGLNSGALATKIGRVIKEVEGVEAATPLLVKFVSEGFHTLFGVDPVSFQRVNGGMVFHEGRIFQEKDEAIVDSLYASVNNVRVGQILDLLGHRFRVSGIFQEGTAGRIMVPLETLQEINGTPEKATVFFIRARKDESL